MSYISRILNENLSDNESDDEICILEEITLNKDETKVSPMKTEVRQEVIESTIEIDGSPAFPSPPPTPRLTSTPDSVVSLCVSKVKATVRESLKLRTNVSNKSQNSVMFRCSCLVAFDF